jgi:excisionase family DNA binding protein
LQEGYLSLKALASYSGLCVRTLRTHLTHPVHPLAHYRVGGRVLIKRSEFDAWIAQFRITATPCVDAAVADILKGL